MPGLSTQPGQRSTEIQPCGFRKRSQDHQCQFITYGSALKICPQPGAHHRNKSCSANWSTTGPLGALGRRFCASLSVTCLVLPTPNMPLCMQPAPKADPPTIFTTRMAKSRKHGNLPSVHKTSNNPRYFGRMPWCLARMKCRVPLPSHSPEPQRRPIGSVWATQWRVARWGASAKEGSCKRNAAACDNSAR